ncbi:YlcI/YnfO family protein [Desulfofundulus salinus]|uniref:Ribbon-helix-helix protein, CopG family n=1 Tax=Desulfofundulus salinus TaxID=2419843 RepID=A0A494X2R1_9FIRM|nr:YlcI/YnfO family protein [Desulfofundulus salinum]RKO67497.1 hypothetical protein D7024_11355 [Desulfofundulus salinum]
MDNTRMVHIRLPKSIVAQMEKLLELLGISRNEFIVQAVAEKVAREMRLRGLRETRGVLGPEDAPEWAEIPAADWVRKVRREEGEPPVWAT